MRQRRKATLFLFVSSLILHPTSLLFAFTSLGAFRHGDEIRGVSARSLAMGGACIASCNEPSALFANPAQISQVDATLALSVTPGVAAAFYRRKHSNNTYASDSNTYFNLESFALTLRHPKFPNLTLGGGWDTSANLDFDTEDRSTRNRGDQQNSGATPGIDRIKQRGSLAQWSVGFSFRPVKWFSIGGSALKMASKSKTEVAAITLKPGAEPITQNLELVDQYTGNGYRAGASVYFSPTLAVGINYQPQMKLLDNYKETFVQGTSVIYIDRTEVEDVLPDRWGAGILYGIKGSASNIITVDVSLSQWDKSRRTISLINDTTAHIHSNPGYGNILEFHVGYEYIYKDKFPIRLGFYHLPDYVKSPSSSTTFFTAGTGYKWKNISVDAAGEYGKRETSQANLFYASRDAVTDSRIRFLVTLTYVWK